MNDGKQFELGKNEYITKVIHASDWDDKAESH